MTRSWRRRSRARVIYATILVLLSVVSFDQPSPAESERSGRFNTVRTERGPERVPRAYLLLSRHFLGLSTVRDGRRLN